VRGSKVFARGIRYRDAAILIAYVDKDVMF